MPKRIWEKWLDESYALSRGAKADAKKKPVKKTKTKVAGKKPTARKKKVVAKSAPKKSKKKATEKK